MTHCNLEHKIPGISSLCLGARPLPPLTSVLELYMYAANNVLCRYNG